MSGLIRRTISFILLGIKERIIVMPVIGLIILENIEEDKKVSIIKK